MTFTPRTWHDYNPSTGIGTPDTPVSASGLIDLEARIASAFTDVAAAGYAPLASPAFSGTPTGITKANVGLGSVDNTADTDKPVSLAAAASARSTTRDASALRRLAALASNDRTSSAMRLRRDGIDATVINELWPDLTQWAPTTTAQVSAGRAYGMSTAQNPGGAARWFTMARGHRFRIATSIRWVAGGTDYAMVGLSTATPPLGSGGASSVMWGIQGSVPNRYNSGVVGGATNTPMTSVGALAAPTVTTTWALTIVGDEVGVSVSLIDQAHSVEFTDRVLWSAFSADIVSLCFWVADTRALSGTSLGPIAATQSINTASPRTVAEGVADWAIKAVDDGGRPIRVGFPAGHDTRVPAPVVMYHHGTGELADAPFSDYRKRAMMQTLMNAGYIVASCDGAGDSWGNDAGIAAYEGIYRWIRDHVALGPIHHLAQSAGGITALLTIARRTIPAASLAMIYPVTSLASAYATSLSAGIDTAYNIPAGGNYATQTAGRDPSLMDPTVFRGLPVWGIASTADAVVSEPQNLAAWMSANASASTDAVRLYSTGTHGDPSNFDATAQSSLLAFLNRNSTAGLPVS